MSNADLPAPERPCTSTPRPCQAAQAACSRCRDGGTGSGIGRHVTTAEQFLHPGDCTRLLQLAPPVRVAEEAGHPGQRLQLVALLTLGWQAPLPDEGPPIRPARHPHRVRVRVVSLVRIEPDPGCATVVTAVRTRGGALQLHPDGFGRMVDALTNLAAEASATREPPVEVTSGTPGTSAVA